MKSDCGIVREYFAIDLRRYLSKVFRNYQDFALKGQSSEILIPFFDIQYIDRPRPEYEPLLL